MEVNKHFDHVVCIDSDGCAMDTMNEKHYNFFGPYAVEEWEIADKDYFLKLWNKVNLFSMTRGCNRFIGLVKVFNEMHQYDPKVPELKELEAWVENTTQLSTGALEKTVENNPSPEMQKVLKWNNRVNLSIKNRKNFHAFDGVANCLKAIKAVADIAIASSGNKAAIVTEWTSSNIISFTNYVFTQENGSKASCLKQLIDEYGYDRNNMIMIGDSPGDLKAAEANNIHFYPVLFNHEKASWNEFENTWLKKFIHNEITAVDQEKLKEKFFNNLKGL